MSTQLAAAVEKRISSPTAGENVTLIIGVESDAEQVVEQIESVSGEVEEELPYDSLAVTIEETEIEALCSIDGVKSIEIEKRYRTRKRGTDFRSQ